MNEFKRKTSKQPNNFKRKFNNFMESLMNISKSILH